MAKLTQDPVPGRHWLVYRGDILEFVLETDTPLKGAKAFVRTNLGNAAVKRAEIVGHVESLGVLAGQDWHNIPMPQTDEFTWKLRVALTEVGHFEAKCCVFLPNSEEPIWPEGDNIHINVEPAPYCCSNSVYCAFVRQFGLNKAKATSSLPEGVNLDMLKLLDERGYSVIPPSGTFRDLVKELDHIVDKLNCRILHLLPVNPTPTTYGRMGRYGSPYAALDFTGIDPELAEFDRSATPLDQFRELVDAVHRKNARLFIDIAINHTGWAAKLQEIHPEWFVRNPDGTIHSPGAWGVTWGDLTELDHHKLDLWKYLADAFLTWCARGVDGFRCDAGYMIPVPAWEYIISRVRDEYPDVIFLLEGLGGDPAVTSRLLDVANMNWAYSELFQNYSREQIDGYLEYAWKLSSGDGLMIHYAETHDNCRLAAKSQKYAKMRTALSALTSSCGAFGFANGVEWFAKERIDVHEASALNWGAEHNQVDYIFKLNRLLAFHPAFHNGAALGVVDSGSPNVAMFSRSDAADRRHLLVAVNLDCDKGASVAFDPSDAPFDAPSAVDLLSGRRIDITTLPGRRRGFSIPAGQAMCLSPVPGDLVEFESFCLVKEFLPERLQTQEARAMALEVLCRKNLSQALTPDVKPDALADKLIENPIKFMRELYGDEGEVPLTVWDWPQDKNRNVMIPPGHCLLVKAQARFRVALCLDGKAVSGHPDSLKSDAGYFFVLLPPPPTPETHTQATLKISVFGDEKLERAESHLLLLAPDVNSAKLAFDAKSLRDAKHCFIQGNGRGAIARSSLDWNALRSRYDAVLLSNLSTEYPEDRHIMLRRMRLWAVYYARTLEFSIDTLKNFTLAADGGGLWEFRLPVGNGLYIDALLKMKIVQGRNAILFDLIRKGGPDGKRRLKDDIPIKFILRPDVEDRNFHFDTKASSGPEKAWPKALSHSENGFDFKPADDRRLVVNSSKGRYHQATEWIYNIWFPNETTRGLEDHGDLFSPGYFEVSLAGSESCHFLAQILTTAEPERMSFPKTADKDALLPASDSLEATMLRSLHDFVVKRGNLKTVIAGYPWFLDWGRDTLICARGLIAAPEFREDVKAILLQFALFSENGTMPNIIHGANASNRDSSDAPLWLFVACRDLCEAEGSNKFLKTEVKKGVTLLDSLIALAEGLCAGASNGVKLDKASGLLFSPSHFTWMDTNYPAGTPRQGYPIEIQALWFSALCFLAETTCRMHWAKLAAQVQCSIVKYFRLSGRDWLSDCLHCEPGVSAAKAIQDDHLRPNQLLAITLCAIEDAKLRKGILAACSALLIPGAIRSLADVDVQFQLPIIGKDLKLLNNPAHPYGGRYEGDEDTKRKPAYHNGTAWTWLFPSFCEAWLLTYGNLGRDTAKAILSSSKLVLDEGCVGHVPEILDGDWPHAQRGCDAQAWGLSELFRVWRLLHSVK